LTQALVESFGFADWWRTVFRAIGEMRGVGWVILFQDPATHRLTNHWITLHQDGVPAGFKTLLVMDVSGKSAPFAPQPERPSRCRRDDTVTDGGTLQTAE
jgi:superoxide dismutase